MSLVQQLLIRALVARFWDDPYDPQLVRWGTELHDRFVLPHFVAQDFQDVIDEIRRPGLPLEHEWFDPHFEFRFPSFGQVTYRDVDVELRQAIEPWHVLGEEAAAAGAARYVDSSVERVQVKVQGMTDDRHVVDLQRPARAASPDRDQRRVRRGRPLSRLAASLVPAPERSRCTRPWCSTSSTPGWNGRWGASPTTCRIRAAVPTTRSRSTPTRPRAGVSPGSSRSAIRRARCTAPPERPSPEAPLTLDLRRPAPVSENVGIIIGHVDSE